MLATGKRARSAEAKHDRREAVLATARALLGARGIGEFTMAALAAETSLAKGTLYLYFDSREALLLALLKEDLRLLFDRFSLGLSTLTETRDAAVAAARLLVDVLKPLPLLHVLLQELHIGIEHGLNRTELEDFKLFLIEGLRRAGHALETCLGLESGRGGEALLRAHALLIGYLHMTNRTDVLRSVLSANPQLRSLDFTFEEGFVPALADQWRAMAGGRA